MCLAGIIMGQPGLALGRETGKTFTENEMNGLIPEVSCCKTMLQNLTCGVESLDSATSSAVNLLETLDESPPLALSSLLCKMQATEWKKDLRTFSNEIFHDPS